MTRDETLAAYQAASAANGIQVKGKAMRYTSMNGNMFSFVDQAGLCAIRLGAAERDAHEAEHGPSQIIQYGKVMRGYVAVPEAIVADAKALAALFAQSVAHAATLKAKPTTRRKR